MGAFFSNLHIRKTDSLTGDVLRANLSKKLEKRGFLPVNCSEDADLSVFVLDTGGEWISLCSDGIDFFTDESRQDICGPLSERLAAYVMTVSCFDSDCLLLNLINRRDGTDAWAKVGKYPGVKHRSTPAGWKGLVGDISRWKELLNRKYAFAEEALDDLEPLLGLFQGQGSFCSELIAEDEFAAHVQTVYYALPETASRPEPPCLTMPIYDGMPCRMGKESMICAVNRGGKSTGLAIAFSGSYVEHEEIRFRDVQLEYGFDRFPRQIISLQLEKRQTQDGQWIYYAEIPLFQLPAGIKEGLPIMRAMKEEVKREFGLRFTPEGDDRKRLDITLHFIPMKNPAGQCTWCVWLQSGNKRAYIEQYNRGWSAHPSSGVELLDIQALDLDD